MMKDGPSCVNAFSLVSIFVKFTWEKYRILPQFFAARCRHCETLAEPASQWRKRRLDGVKNAHSDIDTILPGTLCSFIRPTEELFLCERLPCVTRRPPRIVAVIRAGLSGDQSEQS